MSLSLQVTRPTGCRRRNLVENTTLHDVLLAMHTTRNEALKANNPREIKLANDNVTKRMTVADGRLSIRL